MPRILFICTANYYRSRFAEAVFNHLAHRRGIDWTAFSRGFIPEEAPDGLSPHAANGLRLVGVSEEFLPKEKKALAEEDFEHADRIIALKKDEHEPMVMERFPAYADRFVYWDVGDLPLVSPPQAMLSIKENIERLLDELEGSPKGNRNA